MGDEATREYFCRPDAEAAAKRLSKLQSKYHDLSIEILEQPKYARGRPKNGEPRQVKEIQYALAVVPREKTEAVATKREEAGCFVLLSNVPKEGELAHTEAEVLKVYKEQHGIEQNFAFLKDPVIVNSIFIKKPHRIEALGLVLLLALLIWRLMERSLRQHVETSKTKLTGLNKRLTDSPTSYMITKMFSSVMVIKAGNQRKLARPLSHDQYDYLRALDLDFKIFTIPKPPG
jgi:transposase